MFIEKVMKKEAIILLKPSGTVTIGGDLTEIQRKFYDGFLYTAKKQLEKEPNTKWFTVKLSDLKILLNSSEKNKNNKYYKKEIMKLNDFKLKYNILQKDKLIEGFTYLITEGIFITDLNTEETVFKFNLPNMVKDALLKDNKEALFAKIDLIIKRKLKRKYSLILYDLAKDYENVEIPEMSIEEFREIFGIKNKYKHIRDIKKYVLEPAVKELNTNPDIDFEISYKFKKSGKYYKKIKFIKKRKSHIKQIEQKQEQIKENAKLNALLGLIPEEYRINGQEYRINGLKRYLANAVEKYDIGYLETQIKLVNKKNPDDYIAYLKSAIKEDYAGYYELQEQKEEYKEMLDKYFERAKKIIEVRGLNKDIEELTKELIYIDFNRDKITKEEKDKLLELLERV